MRRIQVVVQIRVDLVALLLAAVAALAALG
jgi:hypothetical protein